MSRSRDLPKLNVLASYAYLRGSKSFQDTLANHRNINLLIDSGAFTVASSGIKITTDEYAEFISAAKRWKCSLEGYFNLDVLQDAAGSLRNEKALRRRGLDPIPVLTRDQKPDELEPLYERSSYVACAGLTQGAGIRGRVKRACEVARGRKLHLLGCSRVSWLKAYKPYSADSSRWTAGDRFSGVHIYMGNGRFDTREVNARTKPLLPEQRDRLRHMGFDPWALQRKETYQGGNSVAGDITACSWVHLSLDMEVKIGVKLFLAIGSASALTRLERFYEQARKG